MTSTMDWHRLQYKRARTLILIMAISNIPAKISAGKIVEMSLPTFNNVSMEAYLNFHLSVFHIRYLSVSLFYRLLKHHWHILICSENSHNCDEIIVIVIQYLIINL